MMIIDKHGHSYVGRQFVDNALIRRCDATGADYAGNIESYSSTLARLALEMPRNVPAIGGVPMVGSSEISRRLRILKRKIYFPLAQHHVVFWVLLGSVALAGCCGINFVCVEDKEIRLTDEQRALNVESFEMAWATVRDQHWDRKLGGLDWQAVHGELRPRVEQSKTKSEYLDAMRSMIDRFEQSHFAIVPEDIYEQALKPAGEGPRDGTTGLEVRVIDGLVFVTKVDEGSPADALGVRPGWQIIKIDGKKVANAIEDIELTFKDSTWLGYMRHGVVTKQMAGKVGTSKSIHFRDNSRKRVTLDIVLAAQKGMKYQLGIFPAGYIRFKSAKLKDNVGYIAFNAFMDPVNVMPAFEKAVKSFMDCEGIIIDIRGNGGGMPAMAMGMAGWLVGRPDQYFGTMHTRDTELKFIVNPRIETFNGPVAVLIDELSASCAEIFPAGLRDMGRARLFGTRTAGAVLPAQFKKLPNGDFFYYPIADYFSKNGARLEGIGVRPDVETPHERNALLEGKDNSIDAAIRWIRDQKHKFSSTGEMSRYCSKKPTCNNMTTRLLQTSYQRKGQSQ